MHEDVKICPECDAEFFAHVTECNGCGVELVRPGERHMEVKPPPALTADTEHDLVCVEQGGADNLRELTAVLEKKGIACKVVARDQGQKSCSGPQLLLVVERAAAAAAQQAIDDHWTGVHPELLEVQEREEQGLCPACGANTGTAKEECPDCGLNLGGGAQGDVCDDGHTGGGCC